MSKPEGKFILDSPFFLGWSGIATLNRIKTYKLFEELIGLVCNDLRRQHDFLYLGDVALRVDEVQKVKAIAAPGIHTQHLLLLADERGRIHLLPQ